MAAKPRILIVEDDLSVAQGLVQGLHRAGFETSLTMTGNEALGRILAEPFDLVVLDLMLPERSGFEILEAVRSRVSVPIVVVSARGDLEARLRSFGQGAVDFVPKPFFLEEVVARIRARLALSVDSPRRQLALGDVVLDLDARAVLRDGAPVTFTPHEFNILAFLRERAGRAVTRAQISDHALPEGGARSDRTVDSHISRIRRKLGPETGKLIESVWGIGYRCGEGS